MSNNSFWYKRASIGFCNNNSWIFWLSFKALFTLTSNGSYLLINLSAESAFQ